MPGYRISVKRGRGYQLPALVSLILLSALGALVSILFWRLHYDGGFSWTSDPAKQFSWHPLLMTISLVTMGLGSIIYRVTPCISRLVFVMEDADDGLENTNYFLKILLE